MRAVRAPAADEDLPGFCERLGIPGLADVHTHFMPDRLQQRVWAYFDDAGPLVGRPWPVRYRWPEQDRVARLRAMNVRLFSALAYAHRPGVAESLNAWTLEFAKRTSGCLPSATFYPEPGAEEYVSRALAGGARIFKVHPQVGGFAPDDPRLDGIWELLARAGTPVVIHAGHSPVGTAHTGPAPFGNLLARHPGLTAVAAHLGAPDYAAFLRLAERHERVLLDTTMVFTGFFDQLAPFPGASLPLLRELGLAGKVLLGSDFPTIPYPYAQQVAGLARTGLGEPWLRAVLWGNAAALFGAPATCSM
jgi:uncharacterized protein